MTWPGGPQDRSIAGPRSLADRIARDEHRDLVPILGFIRRETALSASILRDIAACLSQTLCALATADDGSARQPDLTAATTALQNEDRIQQRLEDLAAALSVLERELAAGGPVSRTDLDRAVIDCLRLEETRSAFAIEVGMTDRHPPSPDQARSPAIGDIDLF